MGGACVQLVGGKPEALQVDAGNPVPIAKVLVHSALLLLLSIFIGLERSRFCKLYLWRCFIVLFLKWDGFSHFAPLSPLSRKEGREDCFLLLLLTPLLFSFHPFLSLSSLPPLWCLSLSLPLPLSFFYRSFSKYNLSLLHSFVLFLFP